MSTMIASESTATARVRGRRDKDPVGSVDEALSTFLRVRSRLFGVAYHILGSAADADDIVQSVWLRWQMKNRSVSESVSEIPRPHRGHRWKGLS
jgi:hypothetical protein